MEDQHEVNSVKNIKLRVRDIWEDIYFLENLNDFIMGKTIQKKYIP